MRAKKSLGQNFLMHQRIAERIALTAKLTGDAVVFEIGPGTGMLTRELLKLAGKVIAVEADRELFEKLQTDFAHEIADHQLELIHGDIRNWDFEMYLNSRYSVKDGTCDYQVVANIPYYLTGEIFRMFLTAKNQPRAMTLLVQKEVAERIVGNPERSRGTRSKKESILSLSVKAYGTPHYRFTVPRGALVPPPNVDSAVLSIADISRESFASPEGEQHFFKMLHAGFAHKRKQLAGNLEEVAPPAVVQRAMRAAQMPERARAEDVSLAAWLVLLEGLSTSVD